MDDKHQAREMGFDVATSSRRHALALMLGSCGWLSGALASASAAAPIRVAISESLVADMNINDARAAMAIWLKQFMQQMNLVLEMRPVVFDTTEEIVRRARAGLLDVVALNVVEYRQIADVLDPNEIMCEAGAQAQEQYILLAKRKSGIQHLGELRGRRLIVLKGIRMCVANAWLSTILDGEHCGASEQFFGSVISESKASRVILPVFFNAADACITSKRGFDMMCELNPQVGTQLTAITTSPVMTPCFYVFSKNYHGVSRELFVKAYSALRNSPSGQQLSTVFKFDGLTVRDISCLASALSVLDAADRAHTRLGVGIRKG